MDAADKEVQNRRNQLRKWINTRYANQAAFIAAHGLNQGEISALLKDKSFGGRKARNLEAKTGMPLRYLEQMDETPLTVMESRVEYRTLPPADYIRLEHLSPTPSMGAGAHISEPVQIVQYLDVLEQWVRQEVGATNPARIKVLTGHGNSMFPTIQDKDLVFVDVECRRIEAAGIYVLDVAGRFILKKAMILGNGTLIIRSDNTTEYPDEERYDLNRVGDSITVCGKVLAWWTLRKG